MARRDEPLKASVFSDRRIGAGLAALVLVALLPAGALIGLVGVGAGEGSASTAFDGYLWRVVRFTLLQALLSTLLSVAPAVLVARALWHNPDFSGRGLVLRLFAVPLALPQIVAVLGLLALYGRAGYLGDATAAAGIGGWPGIYGLSGILIAHVFFNMPLASRLFLEALHTVPTDQWRLASQLGVTGLARFRLLEWPAIRTALPATLALVFMLCATSFTVVLTLGGGPSATTLEVAIYQALRFDFEPQRAVVLTLVQIVLTAALFALFALFGGRAVADRNLGASRLDAAVFDRRGRGPGLIVIAIAALFVAAPLLAVAASGLGADLLRLVGERSVRNAIVTSLLLAFSAATISVCLSYALVAARHAAETGPHRHRFVEALTGTAPALVLVFPPVVLGAGWFILLRNSGNVFAFAAPMIVVVNAVMAMPFVMRILRPTYDAAALRHDRLCRSLGISGLNRLRRIDLPVLLAPMTTAFAFAMALSLGDLGVVALFGSDAVQTLPYLVLQRMGSYRTADAAGLALILGLLCLALMAIVDRGGGSRRARPR